MVTPMETAEASTEDRNCKRFYEEILAVINMAKEKLQVVMITNANQIG